MSLLPFLWRCIVPPLPYRTPVTLNEAPWVPWVWPDSCARVSSVKAQANRGSGKGGALRLQPGGVGWGAGPRCALGAVVLFTVRLVSQDAVHLVCDGRWQLWKNLRRERGGQTLWIRSPHLCIVGRHGDCWSENNQKCSAVAWHSL